MLRLHILASGSGGNAAIVENAATGEGVLIDCGICKRDFFARAEEAGFDLGRLRAVVVTHDHGDHTKGLGVVLRGLAKAGARPAVHASEAVFAASAPLRDAVASVGAAFEPFGGGDVLEAAGLAVRPFRTSHDAADSYGFRFDEAGGDRDSLGYMTDTGIVTDKAWEALSGVRLLALESNPMTAACWRWAPTLTSSSSASRRRADTSPTIRPARLWTTWPREPARGGGHARLPGEQHLPAPARDLRGRHRRARPFHDRLRRLPKPPRDHRVAFLQLHGVHAAGAAEFAEDILVGGRLVGGVDAPVMGFDALLHGRSDEVVCQVARIQTEQLHLVARRSS